jgi:hypothetical protein
MLIQRLLDVVLIHLKVGRIEAADALVELFRDATIFYLNHGNEHVRARVSAGCHFSATNQIICRWYSGEPARCRTPRFRRASRLAINA